MWLAYHCGLVARTGPWRPYATGRPYAGSGRTVGEGFRALVPAAAAGDAAAGDRAAVMVVVVDGPVGPEE